MYLHFRQIRVTIISYRLSLIVNYIIFEKHLYYTRKPVRNAMKIQGVCVQNSLLALLA